jgi:excisionase family DNA binding protein
MIPHDEILTVSEVAVELRCSKAHVHNAINGKVAGVSPLPAIHMGRRRLIRRSALERWKRLNEKGSFDDMISPSLEVDAAARKKGNLYA